MKTKTRKQGNSITLTVPSTFNIAAGVTVEPQLTTDGIFYRFVKENPILNFDAAILTDLIAEGTPSDQLVDEFKQRQRAIPQAFKQIEQETLANESPMTKEQLKKDISL